MHLINRIKDGLNPYLTNCLFHPSLELIKIWNSQDPAKAQKGSVYEPIVMQGNILLPLITDISSCVNNTI
jgi:hypothetical protein